MFDHRCVFCYKDTMTKAFIKDFHPYTLVHIDIPMLSDDEEALLAHNRYSNILRQETRPDDPPVSVDASRANIKGLLQMASSYRFDFFKLRDGDADIADLFVSVPTKGENLHIVDFQLHVLPAYRRQGIATKLLYLLRKQVERYQGSSLITETNARVKAGEICLEKLSATRGLETHTNQLVVADVDWQLMETWKTIGEGKAQGFELRFLDNYPNEAYDDIIYLLDVMNTAPRDKLEFADEAMTADKLDELKAASEARGEQKYSLIAYHSASQRPAGITSMMTDVAFDTVLNQEETCVVPEFRGHNLGKWLKAHLLEAMLERYPKTKFIRTGNADSNSHMLAINKQMGFRPYQTRAIWQFGVEKLDDYLNRN